MVGFSLKNTLSEHGSVARGVCASESGYLTSIEETINICVRENGIFAQDKQLDGDMTVSMNAFGFHFSALKSIEESFSKFLEKQFASETAEFYLPAAVMDMIMSVHTVKMLKTSDKWYGITYKEDMPVIKAAIGEMIKKGSYPEKLWE
jgi:hypothetical protein